MLRVAYRALRALALSLTLGGPAHADEPGLVWAADAEGGAPYIFKDAKDPTQHVGFEVELAQALSGVLKRPITFKQYDYKSLLSGLARGDFDLAMNGLEVTAERQRQVLFTRPYYRYAQALVVRQDEARFTDLDGLKRVGGVVGTLDETAALRLLDRLGVQRRIYEGQVEPYNELASGRIDAVLLDVPIAEYYARPNPRLRFLGAPFDPGVYAIALKPGREDLRRALDNAIGELARNGTLKAIYTRWKIWNDDQQKLFAGDPAAAAPAAGEDLATPWAFARYLPLLLDGAWVTIQISLLSMLLAVLLGLAIAATRLYAPRPFALLAVVYVEFFRGIPVLLLLFFLYFGLPEIAIAYELPVSLKLSPMQAAVIGFGLNYAAYEAEIYRAGLLSVPAGQWEAAASLGLRRRQTFAHVILPQAIRFILPPMTSDFVALFKDTSVVSIIAVVELSKQYQMLAKSSGLYLEVALATAALYLLMSVPMGYLSRRLESRWSHG